jgi:hypothetical protein
MGIGPICDTEGSVMTDVRHELRHPREAIDHAMALLRQGHMTKANAVEAMNRACG